MRRPLVARLPSHFLDVFKHGHSTSRPMSTQDCHRALHESLKLIIVKVRIITGDRTSMYKSHSFGYSILYSPLGNGKEELHRSPNYGQTALILVRIYRNTVGWLEIIIWNFMLCGQVIVDYLQMSTQDGRRES